MKNHIQQCSAAFRLFPPQLVLILLIQSHATKLWLAQLSLIGVLSVAIFNFLPLLLFHYCFIFGPFMRTMLYYLYYHFLCHLCILQSRKSC